MTGHADLVLRRTFFPGWTARLNDGQEVPVVKADGGFQSVRLAGSGTTRVSLQYRPEGLKTGGGQHSRRSEQRRPYWSAEF